MCYQIVEVYSACRCLYYQHAVDVCSDYGRLGHEISKRTILVGYACESHAAGSNGSSIGYASEGYLTQMTKAQKPRRKPRLSSPKPKRTTEQNRRVGRGAIADARNAKLGVIPQAALSVAGGENRIDEGVRAEVEKLYSTTSATDLHDLHTGSDELLITDKPVTEYSDSDDLDSLDNESVISVASSATTVDVHDDAVEALFRGLLLHKGLRNLWPQVVDRQYFRDDIKRVIERFLRRFAEDLETLASKTEESNDEMVDTRRVILLSSKFVRKYRANVASRICEAHELQHDALDVGIDTMEAVPPVKEEEEDAETKSFAFAVAEEFIFETEPIVYLEANIGAFVRQRQQKVPSSIAFHLRLYTSLIAQYFQQAPLMPGKKRVCWTCICGQRISDDYEEANPGLLKDFEKRLKYYNPDTNALQNMDDKPETSKAQSWRENIATPIKWCRGLLGASGLQSLPRHRQDSGSCSTQLGSCTRSSTLAQGDHNFVLLCVPYLRWGLRLFNTEVCRINSDQQFFRLLRQCYSDQRGDTSWKAFRVFRKVRALQFVKFEVFRNKLVDVRHCPSIPDATNTAVTEYTYDPIPPEAIPPIGPNMLMHLFEHPDHADVTLFLYNRFPKKLRAQLEACPMKGSSVGWGVEFVEGLDWFAVFVAGCIGFFLCLIVAISWSTARGDVQGGFGIASFLLAFLAFCGGIIHYMVQN
ncbi:hypothetical protein F5Y19DRAFT_438091 [Xylariaceae sp. FL1651]|nr:hypothetical protein F5Y19DRAFT_438091 [Xylariaceae sp. FL1651]